MAMEREGKQRIGSWLAQPEKRLRFLVATLIALTIVFVSFSINSPEGQTVLAVWRNYKQEMENRKRFQQALSSDPTIGTSIEKLGLNHLLLPTHHSPTHHSPLATRHSLPILVIVFGGCEGCGAQGLKDWVEALGNWKVWEKEFKGVIVVRDKKAKVKEVWERNGWKVSVIADEDGEISKRLNAFFSPRAYGFSEGKLVWVQKRVGMGVVEVLEEFLGKVKGSERAKELMNEWSKEMRERLWGKAAVVEQKGGDRR
ncbi:redoxin family protein [Fervidibacter sacchari]|uniref:peroxiredoxin family protein n=1 Tax=Candidatus Fervidibacter sacchari TaxID=1448929 RepID=UPI002674BD8A|nr:redoxin family protein [Candidatus Fervidibacter sacchari]WKU16510.1 redoxin family protein [Candidatus Fervidibacter sacchari]